MSGELVVLEALAWPQPGPRWVSLKLSGPAEEVRLHLYSSAMNRIHSLDLGPSPAGWSRVALPAEWLETAQGLYFVRVEAQRGRQHSPAFQPLTLYLLR